MLLIEGEEKGKYLQLSHLSEDRYLEYIKNSQNSKKKIKGK